MLEAKSVEFRGSSIDVLRSFPLSAWRNAGYQIDRVPHGQKLDDWNPMPTIGQGVREIGVLDVYGAFHIVYPAKFADAVYVLHCFQKKTQKTSKPDLELAESRYRDLLKELGK